MPLPPDDTPARYFVERGPDGHTRFSKDCRDADLSAPALAGRLEILNGPVHLNAPQTPQGDPPLHCYLKSGKVTARGLGGLLSLPGLDLFAVNAEGKNPLYLACEQTGPATVGTLLAAGAAFRSPSGPRRQPSPLTLTLAKGWASLTATLLQLGADCDDPDFLGACMQHPQANRSLLGMALNDGALISRRTLDAVMDLYLAGPPDPATSWLGRMLQQSARDNGYPQLAHRVKARVDPARSPAVANPVPAHG